MDRIPLNVAKKIRQLMQGEVFSFSQMKSQLVDQMIDEGVLQVKLTGRSRKTIFANKPEAVLNFLSSHLGINDIEVYISNLESGTLRAENIVASSDSKSSYRRTFKGFLVNSYSPIEAVIKGKKMIIAPKEGTYLYIHDFEDFVVPTKTLIVGVENPENFRFIEKQAHLFDAGSILFVSRYPQSKDIITWLNSIPNKYLHFGDFDFEGLRIFKDEYYKHLIGRASFFIPENIEMLLDKFGNKKLYDRQYKPNVSNTLSLNKEAEGLVSLFHRYKKCLEQEVLIEVL